VAVDHLQPGLGMEVDRGPRDAHRGRLLAMLLPDARFVPLEGRNHILLAAGNREAVVETVFREVLMMPEEDFTAFRAQPSWPARVAAATGTPGALWRRPRGVP
jgi:hypothetical protein